MRYLLLIYALLSFCPVARSQDFNYTASADSVAWNELNAQTILNSPNTAWDFSYRIPIGFTFNFLGRNFDSLTIETNGFLVFDADRTYTFTAFNQFGDRIDTSGNHSVLGYELSGSSGSYILKIQFKNTAQNSSDFRSMSWQLWLYETGAIEVRTGPNDYHFAEFTFTINVNGNDSIYTAVLEDTTQYAQIGLINANMDTPVRAFLIGGNPTSPATRTVNDENPDFIFLRSIPRQGYRYIFSPANN